MSALYTAVATSTGGRVGKARTPDGALEVDVVVPKELGGEGPPGTNPEQLFAAGYAACFGSAVALVAAKRKLDASDATVTANVDLLPDGRGFGLGVKLQVSLPKLETEDAQKLVELAHEVCPYSNATRGNIEVALEVEPASSPAGAA